MNEQEIKEQSKQEVNDLISNAFNNFKKIVEEKNKIENQEKHFQQEIIEEKKKTLLPIRNLFRRFIEIGLVVKNAREYAPLQYQGVETNKEVLFDFKKRDTIGKNAPGIDFIIEHPCYICITVLNKGDPNGLIFISVGDTKCPDVELIKNKHFKDIKTTIDALTTFFAKNAVKTINLS